MSKKGDISDCGKYRRISLLSIPGKKFSRILLNKLSTLEEDFLPKVGSAQTKEQKTWSSLYKNTGEFMEQNVDSQLLERLQKNEQGNAMEYTTQIKVSWTLPPLRRQLA